MKREIRTLTAYDIKKMIELGEIESQHFLVKILAKNFDKTFGLNQKTSNI